MRTKRISRGRPTGTWKTATGVASAIVIFLAALVAIPEWTVGTVGLTVAERVAAVGATRQLIALLGGGTLAVVGVYYTHQRHIIDRRTNELQQDSNYTDRYTAAITQLGSGSLTIRLGGVYALERIARDSVGDRETVQDVLAAFIRADGYRARTEVERMDQFTDELGVDGLPYVAPQDVYAALTVLARSSDRRSWNRPRIDLSESTVGAIRFPQGANLTDARLDGVYLNGAQMYRMDLSDTNLSQAFLSNCRGHEAIFRGVQASPAYMHDSDFTGADFTLAALIGATLSRSILNSACFVESHLERTNLTGATLVDADFRRADILGAEFTGADLSGAKFTGAVNWCPSQFESAASWSLATVWPDGFTPLIPEKSVDGNAPPQRKQ